MTSWILGDVHGCAEELSRLLERLAPDPADALISCGDLFHRGPDPAGVLDLVQEWNVRFVLGNHEHRVLQRLALAPRRADCSDRPPLRESFPPLEASDLAGDGGLPCRLAPVRRTELARFLQQHSGYLLDSRELEGARPTPDGRPWLVVHAGIDPARGPAESGVAELTSIRRTPGRGRPWWYERWEGPELIVFGHTHSRVPRRRVHEERLVALGLDTGCVYGGALTAYSPELDELVVESASARHAA